MCYVHRSRGVLAALFVTALAISLSSSATRAANADNSLTALKQAGTAVSVVIYPTEVLGQPNRQVGEALGLVLESRGMSGLEMAEADFVPPAQTEWEALPSEFSQFIRQQGLGKGYAIYVQFIGEPRTGPSEVRFVIVDCSGKIAIADRQTPEDADFKQTAARDPDPMGCSVLVAKRLFALTGWKQTRGHGDGKFAKLWAEKSGAADAGERRAMKERQAKLRAEIANARFSVYPTQIGAGPAVGAGGENLGRLLNKELGCAASAAQNATPIDIAPSSNQQKRLWDLLRGLSAQLQKTPIDGNYALAAEYVLDPEGGPARAVNIAVCTRDGDWVLVDFQNEQSQDFKHAKPESVEDCDRVVADRLAKLLRQN